MRDFLERAVRGGARLLRLNGQDRYVYIRHQQQLAAVPGQAVLRAGWIPIPVPALAARPCFYATARPDLQPGAKPLVSCIMPTRDRRAYVGQAIEYFLRQDYPAKELIILDDGDDPIGDLVPDHPGISYHRLDRRTVLGAKRNLACELAAGDLIAHWDDDDWQAPRGSASRCPARWRGGRPVRRGKPALLGSQGNRAWRYTWPAGRRQWAAGASLCYPSTVAAARSRRSRPVRTPGSCGTRRCGGWPTCGPRTAWWPWYIRNTVPKTGRGAYWTPAVSARSRAASDNSGSTGPGVRRRSHRQPQLTLPFRPPVGGARDGVDEHLSHTARISLSLIRDFELRHEGELVEIPPNSQRLVCFLAFQDRPYAART